MTLEAQKRPMTVQDLLRHTSGLPSGAAGANSVKQMYFDARIGNRNDTSAGALDPNFQGVARLVTGASGEWRIKTIRPGLYGRRTRHIHCDVTGRAHRLISQMYFPEDVEANARDRLFKDLGGGAATSLAALNAPDRYRWDIVLMDAG